MDRGSGYPYEGNYTGWMEQKQARLQREEKTESARQKALDRELEWARMAPRARVAKNKARLTAYEKLAAQEYEEREDDLVLQIPPGAAARRHRRPRRGRPQGLRRQPADGGPRLRPAARRHRRRHRPQRRGQDDPVPHDGRPGEARRGQAHRRRERAVRLRRSGPRHPQQRRRPSSRRSPAAPTTSCSASSRSPRAATSPGSTSRGPTSSARSASCPAASATASTSPSSSAAAATSCCSTSRPTTSTWTPCARSEDALVAFGGCAVVISHDRWFLDRICTHILAFEGDSKTVWSEGNYQTYESLRRQRMGEEADQPHRIRYKKLH